MPPNWVELWTCASLPYGNGAISWLKYSTIAAARRNDGAAVRALSGKSHVAISTQRPLRKQGRPSVSTRNGAAPMTMLYGEIGSLIVQPKRRRAVPSCIRIVSAVRVRTPLAMTSQVGGATILNDAVALSAG